MSYFECVSGELVQFNFSNSLIDIKSPYQSTSIRKWRMKNDDNLTGSDLDL